jgi:hypothetical protein
MWHNICSTTLANVLLPVVVVLRTNLCHHEYLPQNQHWHFPASNCCPENTPHHPLDFSHLDPGLQCLLLLHFHLPMLAGILLLGAIPGRKGQVHSISRCRQLVLRILRVELCYGLDVQYCSDLHCSRIANESKEEDHRWFHPRILRHVSCFPTWSTRSCTNSFKVVQPLLLSVSPSSTASTIFPTSSTLRLTSPSGLHARPALVSPHLPWRHCDLYCARSSATSQQTATPIGKTRESGLEHTPVDRATNPTQVRAVTTTFRSQAATRTFRTFMSSLAATSARQTAPSA